MAYLVVKTCETGAKLTHARGPGQSRAGRCCCGDRHISLTTISGGFGSEYNDAIADTHLINISATSAHSFVSFEFYMKGYIGESMDTPRKARRSFAFCASDPHFDYGCIQLYRGSAAPRRPGIS